MAIEGDVQAVLGALVGGRCYPLVAPELTPTPYIIFMVISNPILNSLDGAANVSNRRVQVDAWDDSYNSAKSLGKLATTAMNAAGHLKMNDNPDKYESETKIYAQSMDFSVWGAS